MDFAGIGFDTILVVMMLTGVVAFLYSNLGLGGGQFYVPIMVLFFGGIGGLAMKEIVPLSLCFAFFTMLSAVYSHNKKGLVDFRLGLLLAAGGLVGVAIGVTFTASTDEQFVKAAFAAFLVIVATRMLYDQYKAKNEGCVSECELTFKRRLAGIGVSVLTGVLVGSFGIGGGVVSVPLIVYVFKFDTRKAIGTSALMGAILTPAALLAYAFKDGITIHYDLALVLTPVVFVLALIGSTWGLARLKTRSVRTIFTLGVYLAAFVMVYSLLTQ